MVLTQNCHTDDSLLPQEPVERVELLASTIAAQSLHVHVLLCCVSFHGLQIEAHSVNRPLSCFHIHCSMCPRKLQRSIVAIGRKRPAG